MTASEEKKARAGKRCFFGRSWCGPVEWEKSIFHDDGREHRMVLCDEHRKLFEVARVVRGMTSE
jgi:hypothetical protein